MGSVENQCNPEQAADIVTVSIELLGTTAVYDTAFRREMSADPDKTRALLGFATQMYGSSSTPSRQEFIDRQVHKFAVSHVLADFRAWQHELMQTSS